MPEETPGLHIDTDWKKQAQEEKRRLAEQEAKRAAPPTPPPSAPATPTTSAAAPRSGKDRELPPASISSLIQSLLTQSLFYLGDIAARGSQPMVNLDMAKQNVDLLGVIEEKTKGNLTPDEQQLLDAALYESRMRFVSVASQYIS